MGILQVKTVDNVESAEHTDTFLLDFKDQLSSDCDIL